MFEKFTSKDARDFYQRYQSTYGFFRQKGKKTLVQLTQVGYEGRQKFVEFTDKEGLSYLLYADSEDQDIGFEFLPPKNCYHNTNIGPLLVQRIPARQYTRGICEKNTRITSLSKGQLPVNFEFLEKCYVETLTAKEAYEEAVKNPKNNLFGEYSPSSNFSVCEVQGQVYCLGHRIGTVKKNIIKLNDFGLWGTEMKDAFRRAGIEGVTVE